MRTLKTVLATVLIIACMGAISTYPGFTKIWDGTNTLSINSDGQAHVVMEGKVDTGNSTTTPLGGGGVFTGTGVSVLPYSGVSILVGSDVAGTLAVQYSPDNADWHGGESYTILAGANKYFTPPIQSAYMRLVYTNGGAAQATFYIHTVLKKSPLKWSGHNITDPIVSEDDAELVLAVITGLAPDGSYKNVLVTNSGNQKISIEELESGISSNSNSQLNITAFDTSGNEYGLGLLSDDDHDIDGLYGLITASGLYGRIDADTVKPLRMDASTHSLQTISYEHHEIHSGSTFRVQHYDDAIPATGSGGELVIAFHVPDTTEEPHMTWEFVHEGDMTMTLYEGITFDPNSGTDRSPKNSNRNSAHTSILQGYATGSLVSDYVTVGEESADTIYSGGTVISLKRNYATKNTGASGARRQEVVLKTNTSYAFVLDNNEATTQGGQIRLEWYEHTPKD